MIRQFFILSSFLLVICPNILWAQKMGITVGMGQMSLEATKGLSTSAEGGYQFGTLFYSNLSSGVGSRVGVLFTERDFSFTAGTDKTTVKLSYLQVPLTATFAITPQFALYGGGNLNLNVSKSCTNNYSSECTISGLKTADLGLTAGAMLSFMDSFGAEVFYEKPLNAPIDNTSNPYIVGINLLYIIE